MAQNSIRTSHSEILGHPKGLWVLSFTEAWLAFAQYGVLAILVFYMRDFLLKPEHIAHVWGMMPVLSCIQWLYAPVGIQAMAGGLMGLFMALLYVMPLFGSVLADRILGRTRTIILGGILTTLGYGLMSMESMFIISMLIILIGTGCCGSLKAQVGALYQLEDRRRSDAYQFFVFGIQVTTIISPLLCGFLGQIAWWMSFAAACAGMMIGLITYIMGRHTLPVESPIKKTSSEKTLLTRRDWQKIVLLLGLVLVFSIGALPNQDIMDGYLLWANQHYRLDLWAYRFPVSSLISLDGFVSAVTSLLVLWFWQWYEKSRHSVHEIDKVVIGCAISILGPLFLAAGSWVSPGLHHVSLWWGIAILLFLGVSTVDV